jgi:hypothetical protein
MDQEKRRSPRYFFFAGAELTEEDSQIRIPPRVSERCLHGCYLDMMNPFPMDTVVLFTIESGNALFQTRAKTHSTPTSAQANFPRPHPGSFTAGWNRPPKPENQVGSVAAALRRHPASFFP